MPGVRVLDNPNKTQQRLGFLKHLVASAVRAETSGVAALGQELVEAVTRTVSTEVTPSLIEYARTRLTDGIYRTLRAQILGTQPVVPGLPGPRVHVELQDLYLASEQPLPSRTGKLGAKDWQHYPYLATGIGLIRAGTWSPLDRGVVFVRLTPRSELDAFRDYDPAANPLVLSIAQRIFLVYSFVENDGDVLVRLYAKLPATGSFSDRDAGDLLPGVYRAIVQPWWNRNPPVEVRDRLDRLTKVASSIEKSRQATYSGVTPREHASRPRLEPFADLGFLVKSDPYRFEYQLAPQGTAFFSALGPNADIGAFLESAFFGAWVQAFGPTGARPATPDQLRAALVGAWTDIKSPLGYAPIVDTALLAGIRLLVERNAFSEIALMRQFLRDWQKEAPTALRFGVDRMGNLAHVRLLEARN